MARVKKTRRVKRRRRVVKSGGRKSINSTTLTKTVTLPSINHPVVRYKKAIQRQQYVNMQFEYKSSGQVAGTLLAGQFFSVFEFRLNSMYDFEQFNRLENKQPLFYDQYVNPTDGYFNYTVNRWKTTIHIMNVGDEPFELFYNQSQLAASVDTLSKCRNNTLVQSKYIGAKGATNNRITFKAHGTPAGVLGVHYDAADLRGYYNTSPTAVCLGQLLCNNMLNTNNPVFYVKVIHTFYSTLGPIKQVIS